MNNKQDEVEHVPDLQFLLYASLLLDQEGTVGSTGGITNKRQQEVLLDGNPLPWTH